jgi:hypothetical protein
MRTKLSVFILAGMLAGSAYAQTPINKTIPVGAGQKLTVHFDYPELIKITSWDKNEIAVGGTVSINSGENDDAFELKESVSNNTIYLDGSIKNIKSLPQRITIYRDGQKIMFKTKADYKEYVSKNGGDYNHMSWGVDMDIIIEIKVPRNMETKVESVYGMVEVKDFTGPLTVDATYGGVDAALQEAGLGELIAETNYGQIYTNLNVKFSSAEERDFHTYVSAKPGKGPRYSFESKYGNVYLRKLN